MDDITYAIKTTDDGTTIRRTEPDGTIWWVPEALGNRHYEEYLLWVSEGNEPELIENGVE
jgi:hypothetical protein